MFVCFFVFVASSNDIKMQTLNDCPVSLGVVAIDLSTEASNVYWQQRQL